MVKEFLSSLYYSDYKTFFLRLADIEALTARHRFLAPHRRYYVREMRILAYSQLLESYRRSAVCERARARARVCVLCVCVCVLPRSCVCARACEEWLFCGI